MGNTKIKEWYTDTFPKDELGHKINGSVTFKELFDNYGNVYES